MMKNVNICFGGLGKYLGFAEPQDKAGSLLHMITDTGMSADNTDNIQRISN